MEPFSGQSSRCSSCQSLQDLDVYFASPAGRCGALGLVSQAGPAHSSRHMAVPCSGSSSSGGRGRGVPFEAMGDQSVQDPNQRICVLWKNTSTPSTAMGRELSIVQRGDPSTLPMALHFVLQREHVVKLMGRAILKLPFSLFLN